MCYAISERMMNMPLANQKVYTTEDIYTLPEGERAELIDGKIYYMAPPSRSHQELLHFLDRTIGNYLHAKNGSCKIYPAPFAVFLNENNSNYVEPDLSIICDINKLTEKGCNGAPDWIIEIVSPSSRRMDYYVKLFKYRTAGVHEYWIIDQERNRITVYNFVQDTFNEYQFTDTVKVGIYEDLEIPFADFS